MLQEMELFLKTHKKEALLNVIAVCICYFHMAFSENIGIDTEALMINEPNMLQSWNAIGRQGLGLTKILFNLEHYNPYFSGVLFLVTFILLGLSVAFLCWIASGRNDNYPYGLFLILFSTCPVWIYQFYFSMQRTEVLLGLLYAVCSAFALCQMVFYQEYKIYWILIWLLLGIWSFCSYQGSVMFYIGLCIVFFLLDFAQSYMNTDWKKYAANIGKLMGGFLIVYVINTVATRLLFGVGEYTQSQIVWGRVEFLEIVRSLFIHIKAILVWQGLQFRSPYPLAGLCLALLFLAFCMKREIKKSVKFILFLAFAGLMASPFLLHIYLGNIPVPRSQFVLQLVSAFGCMFAYGIWEMQPEKRYRWMQGGTIVMSVLMVWLSAQTIFRLQYTDDVRYKEDVRVASHIWEEIQRTGKAKDLPVLFVGVYNNKLNDSSEGSDMFGGTFWGWDCSKENPTGGTGRILGFLRTQGLTVNSTNKYREEAVQRSETMKCYPEPGYIEVEDDFVVVKLSDVGE